MRLLRWLTLFSFVVTIPAFAEMLPGFRMEPVASAEGFVSSVVTDSQGTIYFTTTDGRILRVEGEETVVVAQLPTRQGGNGGMLGMALADDRTAVVHYTTWNDLPGEDARVLDDVVSRVDLATGIETVLHAFACDIDVRERGASSEHHGGNLIVAPDGSIFLGIGDYGTHAIAQQPGWNAGRIWRIDQAGQPHEWATGLRNPYDLAWDPELGRIVVADNGPVAGDEIHIIDQGDNCGWPVTYGDRPPMEGAVVPDYVFPMTVAPTGLLRLQPSSDALGRGYLLGAFVTRALYYFPDLKSKPIADPIAIIDGFKDFILDVTQAPDGTVYVAAAGWPGVTTIYRLHTPQRGDCNGDGVINAADLHALADELREDGDRQPTLSAHSGTHRGSWGCDVNGDGMISEEDADALSRMLTNRRRAVRR